MGAIKWGWGDWIIGSNSLLPCSFTVIESHFPRLHSGWTVLPWPWFWVWPCASLWLQWDPDRRFKWVWVLEFMHCDVKNTPWGATAPQNETRSEVCPRQPADGWVRHSCLLLDPTEILRLFGCAARAHRHTCSNAGESRRDSKSRCEGLGRFLRDGEG